MNKATKNKGGTMKIKVGYGNIKPEVKMKIKVNKPEVTMKIKINETLTEQAKIIDLDQVFSVCCDSKDFTDLHYSNGNRIRLNKIQSTDLITQLILKTRM